MSGTGTPLQNGASLRDAIAGITNPSAALPAKVLVEPGVYDLGATRLDMRSFVDVQGSGSGVTKLTASIAGAGIATGGVVSLRADMVLSGVTIENTSATVQTCGVTAPGGTSLVRLRDSVITINQPSNVIFATSFDETNAEFDGVTIIGLGASSIQGFRIDPPGTGIFRNGSINVGSGIALMDPGSVGGPVNFRVVNSQLVGAVRGNRACVGAYNGAFAPLNATCN